MKSGDGCDEFCHIELVDICFDDNFCSEIICGDGDIAFQQCDDGNSIP
jgi:hypothetical protein